MNINPSNAEIIRDFLDGNNDIIQGQKLIALHRLIQTKGGVVSCEDETDELNGQKAYRFSETEYVCIVHKPVHPDQFFPCITRNYKLTYID